MSSLDLFPLGSRVTLDELQNAPHPIHARLRAQEPVSWLPALGGWLVTRRDLAVEIMRDAETFTVDDPRFTTGQVVGPSMLSLEAGEHRRHREPFIDAFRPKSINARFVDHIQMETRRLIDALPQGHAELRKELAGPLSVNVVAESLGLENVNNAQVLAWYEAMVHAVQDLTVGNEPDGSADIAYEQLAAHVGRTISAPGSRSLLADASNQLSISEVTSNAAVLMFGGIETTEGMILNVLRHLLTNPEQLALVRDDPALIPNAIEESLRLEPAASVVDRYATVDIELAGAPIRKGDLVVVSLTGANRDPACFDRPDEFDVRRKNAKMQLGFAHGPHVCIGAHLARLETQTAVRELLQSLPGLRLDPEFPSSPSGLVFRKPTALHVLWDA